MAKSKIFDAILEMDNRTAPLKVVFVDVQAFSKRRSRTQAEVVNAFMACLKEALERVSRQYAEIARADGLDFQDDVIAISSGDGAAVVFPFAALFAVHLDFARTVLDVVHSHNKAIGCEKFVAHGWCNCHPAFNLSVGISDGQGVIYRDLNGNYNVAGNVINMAACVRQLAGPCRVFFTEEAHNKIIDMVDNPYLEPDCGSIDSTPPKELALCTHMDRVER
jgi:class 3 adenylate cyclase